MTLSQLPHLMSSSMLVHTFDDVSVGDIYEEACVVKADSKHGVYFKLPNGCKAFASVSTLLLPYCCALSLMVHRVTRDQTYKEVICACFNDKNLYV